MKRIRRLVELMNEHELTEIDLRQGDQRIRLRKGREPDRHRCLRPPMQRGQRRPAASGSATSRPSAAKADESKFLVIKSPMVGTFYAAASPESPPFVKVGDHVGPETTVCIIEAMKVFNEIPAEVLGPDRRRAGRKRRAVEFGQPLFRVEPN